VVAFLVHEAKRDEFVEFALETREPLWSLRLVAPPRTGRLLELAGLRVDRVSTATRGEEHTLAALVVGDELDGLIFLRDAVPDRTLRPEVQALLAVCDLHRVPVAANIATAEILIDHLAHTAAARAWNGISHPSVTPAGRFPWSPTRRTSRPRRGRAALRLLPSGGDPT
jgi:methylglyoxal synthase